MKIIIPFTSAFIQWTTQSPYQLQAAAPNEMKQFDLMSETIWLDAVLLVPPAVGCIY